MKKLRIVVWMAALLLVAMILCSCEDEVAVEWVQYYGLVGKSDVLGRRACAEGFYNIIAAYGDWVGEFNRGNADAWEEHFKREATGGTDMNWIDSVDFAYFAGHGAGDTGLGTGSAFTFGVNAHDDWILSVVPTNREPRWGDKDLEFIVLDVCSALIRAVDGAPYSLGQRYANSDVMRGLHYILGFRTLAFDSWSRGGYYAEYLTGTGVSGGTKHTIRMAWYHATRMTESGGVQGAYVRSSSSGRNTLHDTLDNWCADPDPSSQTFIHCSWPCD